MIESLPAQHVEERLNDILSAVLSSRRTADDLAQSLSSMDRQMQNFVLHWAGVVAKSNSELAYQFVENAKQAFDLMDFSGVEAWIISAMDVYDRHGLYPGSASFRDVDQFAEDLDQNALSVSLESRFGVLGKYLIGVSGRSLDVKKDQIPWTDTETLFLPSVVGDLESVELNFQLLKAMTTYLWAQTRFGTFRINPKTGIPFLCSAFSSHRNPAKAQKAFEAVEEVRLLSCIQRELPGIARTMRQMHSKALSDIECKQWEDLVSRLRDADADVHDSLAVAARVLQSKSKVPGAAQFRASIDLDRVRLTAARRVEREKEKFQNMLSKLVENMGSAEESVRRQNMQPSLLRIDMPKAENGLTADSMTVEIDGELITPQPDLIATAASIVQDFGMIPDGYLAAAGSEVYRPDLNSHHRKTDPHCAESERLQYDEWDYRRKHYRKNWCHLRETEMPAGEPHFVEEVLKRHAHLVNAIRKTFEVLRGDERLMRRQKFGDDIDIEAVVDGYVDNQTGMEMSDRLFTTRRRLDRDLAVVFMVDLSGSTKGWINDAEKQSLILLCEALEKLGDRYAIYGFSGMTRKRCELFRIKRFDEPYDDRIKARIAGIRAQDYTRMGVIIRHLSRLLLEVDAKTKVLITLSDGKPDDYDGYRGDYGIEDTRRALIEAKHAGIHPFCITIDIQAHSYLPHMYGQVNYTVVSDISKLPASVSNIYRKFTS